MKRFSWKLPVWLTDYLGMAGALAILLAVFGFTAENFFSRSTFLIIADQVPDITILAVGMTFVLIIAGIDLSVGSVMGLSGTVVGALLVNAGQPVWLAVMAGVVVGFGCGLLNGLVTVRWSLPSFIVTLGMMEIARGAALRVTQSRTIYIPGYLDFITETRLLGISLPFLLAVGIVLLAQLVLSRTVFGRYMVAVGTNEEAVRLSGINPRPIKLVVFALSGLLAGLASIIQTARYQANPNNGQGVELQVIAAVVIGGTSLMGGRGSVISTFFGVLIISVLETGLAQANAQESTKRLITGAVIVAAVILDYYRQRIRHGKAG
ncbi:MAG: ABC transporter permease [Sedimentisphaerales bacterium]|nr:ABC transporter permease [Sedimentisphaerales bacterium]